MPDLPLSAPCTISYRRARPPASAASGNAANHLWTRPVARSTNGPTGLPVLAIAARAVPYVLSMLLVVLVLAFVPELSLWAIR